MADYSELKAAIRAAIFDNTEQAITGESLQEILVQMVDELGESYVLPEGGIPATDLAQAVRDALAEAVSAYQLPVGGIPEADLAQAVRNALAAALSSYQKPPTGIPASDLAAGVIPAGVTVDQTYDATSQNAQSGVAMAGALAGKQDTIDATHKLSYNLLSDTPTIPAAQVQTDWNATSGMGVLLNKPTLATVATSGSYNDLSDKPTIPTVPTIDATPTKSSNNLVKSGGVYSEVHPAVESSQPSGGFLPNIVYDLGTLTGAVTFALATPTDNTIANPYYWTFETGSTAPTITWPANITWAGGSAPTISVSKHYEIMIRNNYGSALEF